VSAIGLCHVRFVGGTVHIGLDSVDGATGHRLECGSLRGRQVAAAQRLLSRAYGSGAVSRVPRICCCRCSDRRRRRVGRLRRNLSPLMPLRQLHPPAAVPVPRPVAGCADPPGAARCRPCRSPSLSPTGVAGRWTRRCRQKLGFPSGSCGHSLCS
jgi:hypothetical protein